MGGRGKKRPAVVRRKISEGMLEFHRKTAEADTGPPSHSRCSKCRKYKPLADFPIERYKRKSGGVSERAASRCRKCKGQETREYLERLRKEGKLKAMQKRHEAKRDKEKLRIYQREYSAMRRRKEGKRLVGPRSQFRQHLLDKDIPAQPLAKWLKEESGVQFLGAGEQSGTYGGIALLAERTGVSERRINSILKEEQTAVRLSTVDKILIGLDAPYMLHELYPEDN